MQKTVLITGANRGLGLEFSRQYAELGWQVIATCRAPDTANALRSLADEYANVRIFALDVADFAQIDRLSAELADEYIDVLLNNAGVYGDSFGRGFGKLNYATWAATLAVNTLAPVKIAEAFITQLEKGQNKLIVAVSSLMGSVSDNTSGGSYIYRSSKAGLNAAMKSLSLDLRSRAIGVLIFHPGWVRTDMGGENGLIDAPESVTGMRRVIDEFKLEQSGYFIKYDGSAMPW